jgi:hypothetical protein
MHFVRRACWISLTLLTSTMTLIAGMPQATCSCSSGQGPGVPFGSCQRSSCCCCREATTSTKSEPSSHSKKKSCCADSWRTKTNYVAKRLCNKSLLLPQDRTVPNGAMQTCGTLVALPASQSHLTLPSSQLVALAARWEAYRLPPPTDVVILLHRLTI